MEIGLLALILMAVSCSGPPVPSPTGRTKDLVMAFSSAEVLVPGRPEEKPASDYVHLQRVTCDWVPRTAIYVHPPGQVTFDVAVEAGAYLDTAVGIDDTVVALSDGVEFIVEASRGRTTKRLFSQRVVPRSGNQHGWHPVRVDLSDYAGRGIRLTLRTQPGGNPFNDFAGFAVPQIRSRGGSQSAVPPQETSVVLVSLDTLRVDHMGAFGHPDALTPHLDAFIRSSLFYPEAMSPSHWTLPAHMSLLTSTHAEVHGVRTGRTLSASVPTLAERLTAAGYRTGAFVGDVGWLDSEYGFGRGFECYYATNEPSPYRVRRAREFVENLGQEKIFLFVHFFDAHSDFAVVPYQATSASLRFLGVRQEDFPHCEEYQCGSRELQRRNERGERYSAAEEDVMRRLYAAGVADLDHAVALLLGEMRGSGLLERSLVTIVSDHGEELGDHGSYLHEQLYPELTRALLAMRYPGGSRAAIVSGVPSLIDVAPTVLGYCGLEDLPSPWQGVNLASQVPSYAYASSEEGHRVLRSARRSVLWLRDGDAMAFDRARDPWENRPLAVRPDAPLWTELEAQQGRNAQIAGGLGEAEEFRLTDEEEERLRALGYLP